ncbi:glutathione peroxidase [Heyndrickxia sp. NPDC080065]|uniref:glutathione peroxidase n=1 Tax=Heyndrickxia sp. NPDC080065 TaxID=3390568 RepID=UPI003D010150
MNIYQFEAIRMNGNKQLFSDYQGKVLLIVNTASKCGFTPQFKELQDLYQKYHEKGLEILGFPCNQFNHQDPGENQEIEEFCSLNYGVSFPMFQKINVNGKDAHPLFQYLTKEVPGILGSKKIKWNFTKFLVNREGRVVSRYSPAIKPLTLAEEIEALLGEIKTK